MDTSLFAAQAELADFIGRSRRLVVLTGAGCSTDSGIPDYRDGHGQWKRRPPIDLLTFAGDTAARARYWARSMVGWRYFGKAGPNPAHHALAALEARGGMRLLVTQNVDGLHQAAGNRAVVDLHGRLDTVRCLDCGHKLARADLQAEMERLNPQWAVLDAAHAPDGDADLESDDFSGFRMLPCPSCGGVLKPDVVFFGEQVPAERIAAVLQAVREADAMLVVGSSLMVHSGYRYVRTAAEAGVPVAAVNLGRTRAEDLLALKIEQPCAAALAFLLSPYLSPGAANPAAKLERRCST
ncbi:NAD-dependent protein deacetylase [Pigmentiphaga humi]|uniref:NAD-dependent protein deacetylase n=1 Tax=Pigmentiphaga humi TaxID=2478468 RepID=A0A3P4AY38_9BURK|nr:NAD-dependent protein deacetylase [Pigmentiphaga humi]VCU68330.1 NAD-dependent protein deacetylase [Pigmentiphaga humi]